MSLLVVALALVFGSAVAATLLARAERATGVVGGVGGVAGCIMGLVPIVRVLLGGDLPSLRTVTECVDPLTRGVYEPLFHRWGACFSRLPWVQQWLLHLHPVYILTVIVLGLTWTALRSWILS